MSQIATDYKSSYKYLMHMVLYPTKLKKIDNFSIETNHTRGLIFVLLKINKRKKEKYLEKRKKEAFLISEKLW